jgi:hypothetical protein
MTDRTDERIRALVVELAELAPTAPTFQELERRATTTTTVTQARPRRRRAAVVGGIAIASLAVAVGVVLSRSDENSGRIRAGDPTTTTTAPPVADFPSFRPAEGWETVTTPSVFSVTAANVPLGPESARGSMPWDTVERLGDGDVVLFAMVSPTGTPAVDANTPERELPLSLDDATTDISFEGQPDHIYADRLTARVNGWNIDLLVFYGGGDPNAEPPVRAAPSAATRAAAQEQLSQLLVPVRG